jgi:hypothetical protein
VAYINLSDANTQYARAQSARTIADNNLACPYAKNTYAGEIKKIIDSYRGTTSNLQYVVLIGPDNVIPFFRYPDAAGQGNERLYIPPVNPDGGLNAALQNGLLLSQDEYGSSIQITRNDYNFPLPNAAVGRLVQTAPEITRMLDLYIRANGNMNPQTALITGYDFAADGATAVEGQLQAAINQTTCDTASTSKCKAIITPQGTPPAQGWTADTLRTNFVNQRNDLVFLGGHFSAYDAQAADGQSFITAAEFAASPVDQTNTLVFSVGCHTGYNIPVADNVPLSSALLEPDWSQAFARKGVTAIIGTGYQYGDDQTIGYSERLYLEFSKQLRTRQTTGSGPVVTPIGQALVRAKKSYLDATKAVTGMDQKTVLEAALFGLPMMNVTLPGALNPTADPAAIGTPATVTANPGQNLQLATTELEVNPSLQTKTVQLQTAQNSPTVVPATYLSGADGVVTNPDEPVLPLERRNVNAANQILRGVGFRSGTYSDQPNIFPLISAPATEAGLVRPTFESSVFYPAQLWNINYYDALAGGNARLLVTPAQFKSSAPGASTGTLRSYSQLKLRLYYIPDVAGVNTTNTAALAAAPTIGTVQASRSGSNVTFSVKVTGDAMAGIQEVWVTYTANDGSWRSIDLAATPGDPMTWTATSNLSGVTLDNVRFMVQAANGTGLVTLATNAGNYYKIAPAIPLPAPKATKVTILAAPASTFFLDTPTFQAQLKDVNGVLLSGQAVSFDLGGQSVTATTDGSGIATVNGSFTTIQPVASYNLTALFKGTDSYLPSSDSRSLPVVQKSSVALAISPTTPTTVEYGSPTGIVATLTDSGENKPLGAKLVIFTGTRTDGKVFTKSVFTNFQGQAILQVPEWPSGVFSIKASFAGDSIHQSITSDSTGLTILPATIEVIPATNNQSANLNQPFAKQLQALVKNSHGVPIKGVIVTFTAPDSGPGGTFGYPGLNNIATAMTDNNGIATAPVFTANNIAGGPYIVAATVPGANNPANFSLTNLPPLAITSLDPSSTLAGGPAFTLTVNGVGFIDGVSKVRWDGAELPTTFVSSTQLKAQVAAALITTPKTVQITVANGTIISNALPFTVITASCERPTGLLTEYRVVGGAGVGSPDSTYTLANLVDQFNYTFWRWNNYPKAVAVQVTYPSPRIVTQIQLFTQNPTKAPLIYFQYLDSSGKWSDMPGLSAVTDAGSSYGLKTYSPTTPVTASQFRMVVDNVTYLSDISNFGDLLLCGASAGGGSPVSAPQPPVSHRLDVAAATGTGSTTANVLDGPPSTNWIVDGNPTTPVTLVLDLGSSRTVTGLSYFATGGTGDNSTKVEISDNPSFTGPNTFTLATGVNTGGYGAYGLKAIPLSQVKTGRYIRFTVTNTSGSWVVGGYGDVQVLGF